MYGRCSLDVLDISIHIIICFPDNTGNISHHFGIFILINDGGYGGVKIGTVFNNDDF